MNEKERGSGWTRRGREGKGEGLEGVVSRRGGSRKRTGRSLRVKERRREGRR